MNRVTYTVIGYVLIVVGFVALILGMIGLNLKPLAFLDSTIGLLGSFLVKLLMVIAGFVMFYMSRVPMEE